MTFDVSARDAQERRREISIPRAWVRRVALYKNAAFLVLPIKKAISVLLASHGGTLQSDVNGTIMYLAMMRTARIKGVTLIATSIHSITVLIKRCVVSDGMRRRSSKGTCQLSYDIADTSMPHYVNKMQGRNVLRK
jgi:hypothetical protein